MAVRRSPKAKLKGYVYKLSDDRILEKLETDDTFTDVFGYGDVPERQLALISFEDEEQIDALAAMVRGQAVASYKRVARFSGVTGLEPPLELDELHKAMPGGISRHVVGALRYGGAIKPAPFEAVLDGLTRARPDLRAVIADLTSVLEGSPRRPRGADEVLGFERDAVGLALDAAGLRRLRPDVLRAWRPTTADAPYLQGLADRHFTEDQIVAHDLRIFGDWALDDRGDPLAVAFSDGLKQVTVANVNRTRVESSTGADLIYYSHDWAAFVLVQYKRMDHESGKGWYLRPSRAGRLPEELERLKALPRTDTGATRAAAFRLSDEAAYLKLCRQLHLAPGQGRLADGIYLPVSLYELLISEPQAVGPRGGRRLQLDELQERWVTNGAFVEMVGRGFIGSREADTEAINELIRQALDGGRSVTLAAGGAR